MLVISEDQLSTIRDEDVKSFTRRVAMFLRSSYPGAKNIELNGLVDEVAPLVGKAVSYGLDAERDAVAYVVTAVYLGRDFDEALPSAHAILNRSETPGFVKARELRELAEAVLARVNAGG